ncbi:MAG TPA: helix-turn-helix domain-containing protein, partial [Pyrinomonadaceae bacterium]|nr:helix-turn-helix domain-containing protein [Pyrinomonadaceae bacterium]
SIDEIAKARGLAVSTIENHLCRFIADGRVRVDEIVEPAKIEVIRKAIIEHKVENQISPVKEYLGDDFSYGEIRAVMEDLIKEE